MATQILAVGTTQANSDDVTVAEGDQLTVCLKDGSGPSVGLGARVDILLKADNNEYFAVGALTYRNPAAVIAGSGTYRFARVAGTSCGVFSG